MGEEQAPMATDTFVPSTTHRDQENHGSAASTKPSVRPAAAGAARRRADGGGDRRRRCYGGYGRGTMEPATIDDEKFTEDPKFRF
jgi:hypothetical protein